MSRPVQTGDYVRITPETGLVGPNIYVITSVQPTSDSIVITVSLLNNPSVVKKIIVYSDKVIIEGSSNTNEIVFRSTQQELESLPRTSRQIPTQMEVPGSSLDERGPSSKMKVPIFAMTGVKEIDLNILRQMDDKDLTSACRTDQYISSLCREDTLWTQKIRDKFEEAEQFKDPTISWKDYYIRLNKTRLTIGGANVAAEWGYLDVLEWLAQRNIFPDQDGANSAAEFGQLNVLKWLYQQRNILPTQEGVDNAAMWAHEDVLEWLAQRNIHPY